MASNSFPETYATAGVCPVDLMLTGRATETSYLDTYFNIPAAATHTRSTTSRGDPQQEHDHRRFRADHEAVEQAAPAGRASSSSDGKIFVAPDTCVAVRLGQARALPGGLRLRPDIIHTPSSSRAAVPKSPSAIARWMSGPPLASKSSFNERPTLIQTCA